MTARPISILCVDDNPLVGEAVALWLSRCCGFRVVGTITESGRINDLVGVTTPDLVLMDVGMPGHDAPRVVERLVQAHPHVLVCMLSGTTDPGTVERCLHAGACGYICKADPPDAIAETIRLVAEGQLALSPGVREVLGVPR